MVITIKMDYRLVYYDMVTSCNRNRKDSSIGGAVILVEMGVEA